MYNYEGSHSIDFTKMEYKLCGIISKNNSGKTSLIDIILFALYDVHPRISNKQFIINKYNDSYRINIEFEINYKRGIITKSNKKYTFYFNDKDHTKKTIPQTINEIRAIVGTYNDAIMTSIQLQYNFNNFVNLTSLIRKQKLSELLSLKMFENIESAVVKQLTELNEKYKIIYNYKPIPKSINIEKINKIKHVISLVNKLNKNINESIINNKNDNSSINEIDIDLMIKYYEDLVNKQAMIMNIEHRKQMLLYKIESNKELISKYKPILEQYETFLQKKINILDDIKNITEKINKFDNESIKNVIFKKYTEFGIDYLYKLCKIDRSDNKIALPASIFACLLIEREFMFKAKDELSNIISDCEHVIELFHDIDNIHLMNSQLSSISDSIKELTSYVIPLDILYNMLYEEYKSQMGIEIQCFRQKELADVTSEIEILKIYRQVIKPTNGIINIVLNNIRSSLETNINELIIQFNMIIKITEEYDILYSDINNGEEYWLDISLSSGYQRFILNIAFRIILWQCSDVIIPDVLIIDEGFGMCDDENLHKITNFLKWIANTNNTKYNLPNFVLIISHINYLVNNIEYPLFIKDGKIIDKSQLVHFSNSDNILNEDTDSMISNDSNITLESNCECHVVIDIRKDEKNTNDAKSINTNTSDKYYCEKCRVYIKLSNKEKHLLSLKHNK